MGHFLERPRSSYLITHPERDFGADPSINEKGREQIKKIIISQPEILDKIKLVVVGTGRRFRQVCQMLNLSKEVSVKYSVICGTADAGEENPAQGVLADGEKIKLDNYIGLEKTPGLHAWSFIDGFPENTLFITGSDLTDALGFKGEKGQLYELDIGTNTVEKIS